MSQTNNSYYNLFGILYFKHKNEIHISSLFDDNNHIM